MFLRVVLPFVYLRGLQAPLPDTLKETSVSVPNLTENCVPESGVPSDRSVPNLAANPEPSAASLLETFAAVARRRASGASGATSTNANNSRNTANTLNSGIFGRGLATNSVSSLVRLALSSNFPSGLLNQVCREPLHLKTILIDNTDFFCF